MILSASRRTDIPAFYGEWMETRLREGRVLVPNPYSSRQLREVRFTPETADCIVFWTKNAVPFLPVLRRIAAMGYRFYFQHTLTPYGKELEPGIESKRAVLDGMRRLGAEYGKDALVWRYDPIVLGYGWNMERHLEAFGQLCRALHDDTGRCVLSFLDLYPGRMNTSEFRAATEEEMNALASGFAQIAAEYQLPLQMCAEAGDYTRFGIGPSACIDPELVAKAAGYPLNLKRDKSGRKLCGCAESVDIGMYGSCGHGCRYCYASGGRALRRLCHDPASPMLLGRPNGEEQLKTLVFHSNRAESSGQLPLF